MRRRAHRAKTKKTSKEKAGLIASNVAPPSTDKNPRHMIYFVTKQGHLMAKPMNRKGGSRGRVGICHPKSARSKRAVKRPRVRA